MHDSTWDAIKVLDTSKGLTRPRRLFLSSRGSRMDPVLCPHRNAIECTRLKQRDHPGKMTFTQTVPQRLVGPPAVCWSKLVPALEGQLLTFQKFCRLAVKTSYYLKLSYINKFIIILSTINENKAKIMIFPHSSLHHYFAIDALR